MKKFLSIVLILCACFSYGQTTYYWVGGTAASTGINTGANWNTDLGGLGSPRPSSSGATDILVFDGTNLGGTTPATGPSVILASAGITAAQMKFVNNVNVTLQRPTSGTSTITLAGESGEDFLVAAGSALYINSPAGSIRFTLQAAVDAARVSGILSIITSQQMRFENGSGGAAGIFRFTNGSSFTTNITSSSSSYAFGNSSQSAEKWVVFEDGAQLYYEGGYSPMGSTAGYAAIDFKPGSTWHQRASNPVAGFGSFFNNKSFGNISVENGSTLTADGPVYRINNLTVNNGSTFKMHLSGQTAVMGNIVVNGMLTADATSTNELIIAGSAAQSVSGTGTISIPSVLVADKADVIINTNIVTNVSATVIGKVNFANSQISGAGTFTAKGSTAAITGAGNTTSGAYILKGNTGIAGNVRGYAIAGAGIPANSVIVDLSSTGDSIFISNPLTATASAVALTVGTSGATLATANAGGIGGATGSVAVTGSRSFENGINYQFDAATATPFGISTAPLSTVVATGTVIINAAVISNSNLSIKESLILNNKLTLRPLDTLRMLAGATLAGTFDDTKYIATDFNVANGTQAQVVFDAFSGSLVPIGTITSYLPFTLNPANMSAFSFSVFTGITANGQVAGTPFTPLQRQTVVNAVWQINRISGTGNAMLQLNWPAGLEGSTFSTLPDTDIGLIANDGTAWSVPLSTADNTANTTTFTDLSTFGSFGAGAIPQADPFVFNALADKTFGEADFNGGATSLNTAQPIVYSSSNTAVATIVGNNVRIVGAGTTNITASQASDGFYPAASIMQPLNILKADLNIKADDKTKFETLPNPVLTATYTGFVYGQTATALLTPAMLSTTATAASAPGTYPINVTGATSNNYNISFTNGTLTVLAKQNQTISFAAPVVKTYGAADFSTGATSTNTTIPITYTVSNPSVATVTGNTVKIVGAGTTTITAMQAGSDGYFPAANVVRTLTVNKANLNISVRDTTKVQGQANPVTPILYTGFVLGQTATNLTSPAVISTVATAISSPGYYDLVLGGAVSANYNITYTNGRLTIMPSSGLDRQQLFAYWSSKNSIAVKVYSPKIGLADVSVFDMYGKFLAKRNILINAGFGNVDVYVPGITSGVYAITVKGNGVDLKQLIQVIK